MVAVQYASMMIKRKSLQARVREGLESRPVTALLGPRQCGKTTLARMLVSADSESYFDLEDPRDLARLSSPQTTLESLKGIIVLDEIQRRADLMPLLRVLADRRPIQARFLLLGSASPDLMRHASETLAGRVHFVEMEGLSLEEVGIEHLRRLWLRGGFPESYVAANNRLSGQWREDFIQTFLERDMPQFGFRFPAMTLRRFWTMVAHYHGQTWNGSEIGASLGVSHHATRRYLDALTGSYMIRQLPPWTANVGKRVVKSPKVYLRDSGILHALLGIDDEKALAGHPKLGSSWEGFVIEQILGWVGDRDSYFWATQSRAELDLLLIRKGRPWGFEIKHQDAPTLTRSMSIAVTDLNLEHLWVVYPGKKRYRIHERVECIGLGDLPSLRDNLI
jgi:predicted AAA+ superfamily ATPase